MLWITEFLTSPLIPLHDKALLDCERSKLSKTPSLPLHEIAKPLQLTILRFLIVTLLPETVNKSPEKPLPSIT